MAHNDLLLLLLGSFLPNNLIIWLWKKMFRHNSTFPQKVTRGSFFSRLAVWCGDKFGSPFNFNLWIVIIAVWIWSGHLFRYSNTWQLLINTPTTIIELFAAILIQYVGNRIERRQEVHEVRMLEMLAEVQNLTEQLAGQLENEDIPVFESEIMSKVVVG